MRGRIRWIWVLGCVVAVGSCTVPVDPGAGGGGAGGGSDNGGAGGGDGMTGGDGAAGCGGVDLSGAWTQDTNTLTIAQDAGALTSTFDVPFACDPEDGSGQMFQTDEDFMGMLDGCDITGTINVCRFGCDDQSNFQCGIVALDMSGTVDPGGDRFEIMVTDAFTGDSLTLVYLRQP